MRTLVRRGVELVMFDRAEIERMQVGDMAPNPFGKMAKITKIHGRGEDMYGLPYICFYTEYGENAAISHSLKAGELVRSLNVTDMFKSAELDMIEKEMQSAQALI